MKRMVLLLAGALALSGAAADVDLTEAVIVVASDAVDSTRLAARELADHLKLVTGREYPVAAERAKAAKAIYVGMSPDVAAAGFSADKFARDEYLIAFRSDAVYLLGRDTGARRDLSGKLPWMFAFEEHGSLYAVYDFLRDWCGVEWYDPTEAGTGYDRRKNLKVSGTDEKRRPFFRCRDTGNGSGSIDPELWRENTPGWTNFLKTAYPECWRKAKTAREALELINVRKQRFNLRMKAGGDYVHVNHSFYPWYERFLIKGHKNFEEYHPEWFAKGYSGESGELGEITAEWDSKKEPPQLCYSHPGVLEQVLKDARNYFDNGGFKKRWRGVGREGYVYGENRFCIEPMDNTGFCKCSRCTELYDPHLENERAQHSRYWFEFANKVARGLAKTHPDKKVTTLAYASRDGVPAGVQLEPNLEVHFCFHFNRLPYSREGFKRQLRQMYDWRTAYPDRQFGVWLYNTFPQERTRLHGGFNCFPGYFAKTLAREYAFFKKAHMSAAVYNCGFRDDFENFLSYRWMFNPDEPLAKLKAAYFRQYGAAGPAIEKFYNLVEKTYCNPELWDQNKVHQDEFIAWGRLGVERVMEELRGYAEKAISTYGLTDVQKARVANWKAGVWDYMRVGPVKRTEYRLADGVKVVKTKWLGRRPEEFAHNMLEETGFAREFKPGRAEGRETYLRKWRGDGARRFRVTVNREDPLRASCHFRIIGKNEGATVALTPFTGEYERQIWAKETPESITFTTFDFEFARPFGKGFSEIGIEDASPEKGYNWPRYLKLEVGR